MRKIRNAIPRGISNSTFYRRSTATMVRNRMATRRLMDEQITGITPVGDNEVAVTKGCDLVGTLHSTLKDDGKRASEIYECDENALNKFTGYSKPMILHTRSVIQPLKTQEAENPPPIYASTIANNDPVFPSTSGYNLRHRFEDNSPMFNVQERLTDIQSRMTSLEFVQTQVLKSVYLMQTTLESLVNSFTAPNIPMPPELPFPIPLESLTDFIKANEDLKIPSVQKVFVQTIVSIGGNTLNARAAHIVNRLFTKDLASLLNGERTGCPMSISHSNIARHIAVAIRLGLNDNSIDDRAVVMALKTRLNCLRAEARRKHKRQLEKITNKKENVFL